MDRPSPYQIMAFAHSARERSFTQAAVTLGVSQSSITQHIAKLEKLVGAQLFIRRRNGLELTRAGRELFDVADRWASINSLFEERVSAFSGMETGHLKVTATAPRPALPLIASYTRLYPNVMVEFTLLNWTQNMAALRERTIDLAIMTDPEIEEGMYARKIETIKYRAYMRADHPLARRRKVSLHDLSDISLIIPEDGSLTQKVLFAAAAEQGVKLNRLMKMTTFAVVKEAILHGLGVGILLQNSVHETSRLVDLPITGFDMTFDNFVVVPSEKQNLRLIARFLDGI